MPGLTNTTEAFVTLVTNAEYGLGAAVLGHKLQSVGTTRQTVVMVTESVPRSTRALLARTWDVVRDVGEWQSNDADRLALMKRPELGVTFSKLNVWKLTQYKKVVFIDADTMPLCNIDDLFSFEELSACRDAGWPDCFNTGLFVLQPSLETYKALVRRASDEGSFDGGDQGILNTHFSSWSHGDIRKHIPFSYNVNPNASYTYLPAYQHFADQVKMVHFLGAVKPWHYQFTDGQVIGQNLTVHTREFLEKWHQTADIVKHGAPVTPKAETHPYVPPMTSSSPAQFSFVSSSQYSGAEARGEDFPAVDAQSVLSHISSQIKDKEQARSVKY